MNINIRLGKFSIDIDKLIYSFIVINVLFLYFFEIGQSYIQPIIVICCLIRIINFTFKKNDLKYKWLFICLIVLYLFTITIGSNIFTYVYDNTKLLLYPLVMLYYFSCLMSYKPEVVNSILKEKYIFYNLYYLFNFFFMIYQSQIGVNYDSITGLIGPFGTHRLCMFVCFLVILNFQLLKEKKTKYPYLLIIMTFFIILSTLYISSINDNTAVYIFLPLVIILYFFNNSTFNLKTIIYILLVLFICWIIFQKLMEIDSIATFLNERLVKKINQFFAIFDGYKLQEERYVYIDYALENLNGYGVGVGLGQVRMSRDILLSNVSFGMRNWGMSSMASLITVGGIVFLFLYITLYTYISTSKRRNWKLSVSFWILFFILLYYGITAMDITMMIFVSFVIYPFYNLEKNEKVGHFRFRKKEKK